MKQIVIITTILVLGYTYVFAHPGRLDSSGGHHNRKTGEYHYHRAKPGSDANKSVSPSSKSVKSKSKNPQSTK